MYCKNCRIKHICNIYDFVLNKSEYADIIINNCKYYSNEIKINNISNEKKIDSEKLKKLSNENYLKKKNNVNKELKPKMSIKAEPLILDRICSTCGASTFADDISHCSKCGKEVCSCCATVNSENGDILCQDCWTNL